MKSFSIENIKSFKNKTEIELKPITILVGKNSCGKSSLIRFPVVLAQTYDNGSAPLQLFEKMIDYGTFNDVVYNHQGNDISFSLKYDIVVNELSPYTTRILDQIKTKEIRNAEIVTHLSMVNDRITVTSQKLYIDGECMFECCANKSGVTYKALGEYDYKNRVFNKVSYEFTSQDGIQFGFLCAPPFSDELKKCIKKTYFPENDFVIDNYQRELLIEQLLFGDTENEDIRRIRKVVNSYDDSKIAPTVLSAALLSIGMSAWLFGSTITKKKNKKTNNNSINDLNSKEMIERVEDAGFSLEEVKFWSIHSCFQYYLMLIKSIYDIHSKEMRILSYIGPFRQNPERIYRDAGSLPKKVGVRGENASNMLISDFHRNKKLIESISTWLGQALGYKLIVKNISNGYYQLLLEDKNGILSNLSDVGYGISQILPIVTQMKLTVNKDYFSDYPDLSEISVIEQPELHLHPAAQAELAGLFAACIANSNNRKLLIETHSEHFIRKLQVLIADKSSKITSDDVAIYYVDKNNDGSAYIDRINILPNGQFEKEWPSGFFDKAFELSMELIKNNSEL